MNGTMAQLARHLGVARSTVTRAVQAGRIAPGADGRFDFAVCAAAWHAGAGGRSDVAARHAQNRGAVIPMGHPAEKNATAGATGATACATFQMPDGLAAVLVDDDSGRADAKAVVMHYENSTIKLELALRRGLRYERETAKREAVGLGAMLRAGIERVIDQTAPRIAAAGDALERRRIVDRELRRLRWMFKREMPRALRRMKDAGKAGGVKHE